MGRRKKITYIGFYSCAALGSEGRAHCLAATNKMNYICDVLAEAGYDVLVISPSWSGNSSGWYGGKTLRLGEHKSARFCPTFGARSKLLWLLRITCSLLWLFVWLLLHVRRGENVIVYHTPWIALPLLAARSLRGFKIVLEVEELYNEVGRLPLTLARQEMLLVNRADMYIFSNDLMPELVGKPSKRHVVVYGVYSRYERLSRPEHDGRVHLVYAGEINRSRGDAFNAVESSRCLSDRYVLHILGSGDTASLSEAIALAAASGGCEVIFEGSKSGDDYISSMQRCHIGLSTRAAGAAYLDVSFPSKILSYLSMGLRVVSGEIECITRSRVSDLMTYYSEDSPESIAQAVKSINIESDYDPSERLAELHTDFVREIGALLESQNAL